jgi:hypothetical protein
MILAALDKHPKGTWIKHEAQKKLLLDDARIKLVRAACSHLMDLADGRYMWNRIFISNLTRLQSDCYALQLLVTSHFRDCQFDRGGNSSYACNGREVWGQCRAEL